MAFFYMPHARAAELSEAMDLFRSGKYRECSELARAAIEQGQYSESWPLVKIRSDLARGHYPEALATLEAALARHQRSIRLRWIGHEVCRFNGRDERAAELLDRIEELADGASWRYRDPSNQIALGRFHLHRGTEPEEVLEAIFNPLKERHPSYSDPYIAAGELALEKQDYALAAEQFAEALERDGASAEIHYGLARAFAPSDLSKAQQHLQSALSRNPKHVDSLLFLVDKHIDAERYGDARELLRRVLEINVRQPRAWAYLAVLAHLHNDPVDERICRRTGLLWKRSNPEIAYLIGKKLAQKYRFAEAAAYQRRALEIDPSYLPAKIQLSQDLLRLGKEEQGWELAEEVFEQDGYNVVAHNLITLQGRLAGFRTLVHDGFVVRMDQDEARIYGERVLELLSRAKKELAAKYQVEVAEPVLVEIFPDQQDFAIRTFGLPGGDGYLGVCFGSVITANSPASLDQRRANWEAVLWHEFCHVVTLQKTNNKMPRWLSEGISVYEERQENPTWGQSMTPRYRQLILGGELTPVSQLSAAFLNPPSPMHLQFAYYESSLVVEFIVQEYGLETLQRILVDLGVGMPINESLRRYAGSLEVLDADFAEFAKKRARQLAPQLDWQERPLPPDTDSETLARLLEEHRDNFWILRQFAARLLEEQRWEEAKEPLKRLIARYPEYCGERSAYEMLAKVHRELGETDRERAVLEDLAERRDDAVEVYLRLMELHQADEDWAAVKRNAERLLAVDPLQRAPHRYLARAAERIGDDPLAIEALRVLILMEPFDPVDAHFRLARLLHRAGDLQQARREVLMALEEAPRFLDGHRKLLEIRRDIRKREGSISELDEEKQQDGPPSPSSN